MPPPSKIDQLPDELRAELEDRLIANGFGGYVALSDWLAEKGFEIGKSAIGERGQQLKRRLAAIKASTEAAKLITAAAPDDADDRSNAIMSLVQTEIFDAILSLQEVTEGAEELSPAARIDLLGKAAKNIAALSRASVNRNKWGVEMRDKALLEAAQRVESAAQARGLTAEDAKFWRQQVLMGM
ncbi:DUF3486 family protein [Xanthomonas campestris pv. trichodesmae]|uniref:Terminase n=3 Tax=Xanthomonas citri TaxID=346 RepID=A0AB33C9B9_XANCI|nr:terminase [Xanthomonas citri pv. vignicola]MBV6779268.1 DUF3486 family protein [Xanthomonas campestris pv. trichodesmae]MBZ3921782.1 hypothetical protein [Xanthomonas campestris pv. trichodesmae]MBZ3926382.1 hypothetical protein [Xanthomonas citri pv. sesbaniae]